MCGKIFFGIPLLCAAVVFGACRRDVQGINEEYNPAKPVGFVIHDVDRATRGTPITAASQMTTMGVFASYTGTSDWSTSATFEKMFNQRLDYNSETGEWEYPKGQEVYWGATTLADRYSFFAYAPYGTGVYNVSSNATGNGIVVNAPILTGVPSLRYTVPEKVENQPDLLIAVPKKNVRPTGAPISLNMKHALTCVDFQIAGDGKKVSGISIQGVSTTGTLAIDGSGTIDWTDLGATTNTDFSASLNSEWLDSEQSYTTTENMTNLIAGDGYLMMIPQTLTDDAKVVVTYSDGSFKELALGTQTWGAGQKITYDISITDDGVLAPPGVIGYIKGTTTLTLKGSTEYSVNTDIAQYATDNFGGLSNQTVYVAYFKFGSLVAISSSSSDKYAPYLESNDIIAGPSQWSGYNNLKNNPTWGGIPVSPTLSGNATIGTNLTSGLGDPCAYYTDYFGSGWHLPTGSPYNGTPNYTVSYLPWSDNGELGKDIPAGALSTRDGETGMFYVAAGWRNYSTGAVSYQGSYGSYWSPTASDTSGYSLFFNGDHVNPSDDSNYAYGFAVRCVRD